MPTPPENERRAYWESVGALDSRGQFKTWLHVFGMLVDKGSHYSSMAQHLAYPWLPIMPKPDLAEIEAVYHMTRMQHWPSEWPDMFWFGLSSLQQDCRTPNGVLHGPYWMLLSTPAEAQCAQILVGMKRRLTNEMFKDGRPFSTDDLERRIRHAMVPFLVYPQQEIQQ